MKTIRMLIYVLLLTTAAKANAQNATNARPDSEIQTIDQELNKSDRAESDSLESISIPTKTVPTIDYKSLNANENLSQRIVLQKISMPKTGRFQLFGGVTLIANDQFFRNFGLQGRASYHFSEKWGLELTGMYLTPSKTKDLEEMESVQGVSADQLTSGRNYLGADIYFNSMYGKAALYDREIIPFEFYQTIGLGKMNTNISSGADTVHLGVGQLFSRSPADGFRWDLSLFIYQAQNINNQKQTNTNLALTVGWGFFLPASAK
jgi:outer membrane beta-barrel protein